ncbi:MAG: autotransporter outer membrane beta-barrel domain-containing protein [Acetobacter orientalis]
MAWQHEFLPERYTTSALQLAPEYSFTTHGTESWHDSGRVETGLNLFSLDGWSLYGKFTGVFSDVSRGIAGTGGFHLEW